MEPTMQVFMDYAAAFEQTYVDDDWSRLLPFFSEDATYEVRGGPFACEISGREAIFVGLKKSIDGMDRRCTERQIAPVSGPGIVAEGGGQGVRIDWRATYQYRDAPKMVLPGSSVFIVAGGVIVAMRDEYDDKEMEGVLAWMEEYGEEMDGSYV